MRTEACIAPGDSLKRQMIDINCAQECLSLSHSFSLAGFISTINQSAALDTECEPLVDAHSKSLSAFIAARLAAAAFLFAGGFAGLASFAVFAFALFAARMAWFFFLLAANFALCSASSASSASLNAFLNSLS